MAINQTLTSAINSLEAKVSGLINKIGSAGGGAGGGGGVMDGSMGGFSSTQAKGVGQMVQGGGQIVSGMSQMMPDVQATVERAGSFYNATIRAGGGMSRPQMQQATLQGMRGGLTSPGSDAMVGGYLAQRGMMANTSFGSTYQQTTRAVGNAAKYLNMDNATAVQAIEGLTSGKGSSNMLRQFGILTADPTTGKEKTQGEIFKELAGRLTAGQPQATEEETLASIRRGALGVSIANSGLDEAGQEMLKQYMIERSRGNEMDLSDPEKMQDLMDKAKAEGNENPFLPGYDLNTAKTDAMGGAEGSYIAGIKAATKALEGLTKAGGALASVFGFAKSGTSMFMGDPAGQGFMDVMGGVGNVVGGAFKTIFGGPAVPGDTVVGNASAAGFAAQQMGGNVTPGFGGGRRGAPIGGDTGTSNASAAAGAPQAFKLIHPVSNVKITAVFGQKKSSFSGDIVWPNGHKGVDYAAKLGDTIYAAADGEVMPTDSGGELGNYVKIKHDNGGMYTFYAHLSSKTVSQGRVKKGQPIGSAGNTGTKSSGVHLHFALSTSATTANAIDPAPYMSGAASSLGVTASNPEQTSSGAVPASSGETTTGGSGEDSSGAAPSASTNILQVDSTGYSAGAGASPVQSIEPLSGGSFASSKSSASVAVNKGGEGGDGYTGERSNDYLSPVSMAGGTATASAKGRSGSGSVNNVTINLSIAKATDEEARKFATMLKRNLENDMMMKTMART